ncbi:hypothetical protein RF11_14272 [Thelohanellus kitauei]|uniref:Uncharacterized protein n=1 Tax=Thelohanellus kitauei TaxID=669202 RepID=A0A0C2J995_THEKT|nr:hypothetical protein RF11_14272 [Thelohanellus kitauei]
MSEVFDYTRRSGAVDIHPLIQRMTTSKFIEDLPRGQMVLELVNLIHDQIETELNELGIVLIENVVAQAKNTPLFKIFERYGQTQQNDDPGTSSTDHQGQ